MTGKEILKELNRLEDMILDSDENLNEELEFGIILSAIHDFWERVMR